MICQILNRQTKYVLWNKFGKIKSQARNLLDGYLHLINGKIKYVPKNILNGEEWNRHPTISVFIYLKKKRLSETPPPPPPPFHQKQQHLYLSKNSHWKLLPNWQFQPMLAPKRFQVYYEYFTKLVHRQCKLYKKNPVKFIFKIFLCFFICFLVSLFFICITGVQLVLTITGVKYVLIITGIQYVLIITGIQYVLIITGL